MSDPLPLDEAPAYLDDWLALPVVRVIGLTRAHRDEFARLLRVANATGNLVADAHLAALAAEHGCTLASTDEYSQKFPRLALVQPAGAKASGHLIPFWHDGAA